MLYYKRACYALITGLSSGLAGMQAAQRHTALPTRKARRWSTAISTGALALGKHLARASKTLERRHSHAQQSLAKQGAQKLRISSKHMDAGHKRVNFILFFYRF